jgi:heme-degrading monooxygenase HmoA
MYAVIGSANLDASRAEEAIEVAKSILANLSQAPGFVSGTFARSADGTAGRSMVVFETEEAARAVAENAPNMIPADGPTEVVSLEVFEVVDMTVAS